MTDLNMPNAIFLVSALIIVYRLLRWRMLIATHEERVNVGAEAIRLAFDPRLNREASHSLIRMTSLMYHSIAPWIFAITMAICVVLPLRVSRQTSAYEDVEFEKQTRRVRFHLLLAVLSASPIAFAIGMLALSLSMLVHRSFSMVKLSASQPRGLYIVESLGTGSMAQFDPTTRT